jgi:hypothetical protein
MTKLDMLTGCVATILVVVRFKSDPLVPTLPSRTKVVPSDLTILNHVAVPVLFALESWVIAFSVKTPPLDDGANVALQVSSARSVVAVPPAAGRVPL